MLKREKRQMKEIGKDKMGHRSRKQGKKQEKKEIKREKGMEIINIDQGSTFSRKISISFVSFNLKNNRSHFQWLGSMTFIVMTKNRMAISKMHLRKMTLSRMTLHNNNGNCNQH